MIENKRSLTMGVYFVNLLSVNQNSIFWVFMVWYLSDQFKNCIICEWQLRFCYCLQLTEPRFQIILPDIISTFSFVGITYFKSFSLKTNDAELSKGLKVKAPKGIHESMKRDIIRRTILFMSLVKVVV